MDNFQKRLLLFLGGCIPMRLTLVYLAKKMIPEHVGYMGYMSLIPAIGFSIIYVTGIRKTGAEVFGGKIWWNDLRPIHAALYFTFAYMAIKQHKLAYLPLLMDVIIGLVAFIIQHL